MWTKEKNKKAWRQKNREESDVEEIQEKKEGFEKNQKSP
jgi:hypothetical protein